RAGGGIVAANAGADAVQGGLEGQPGQVEPGHADVGGVRPLGPWQGAALEGCQEIVVVHRPPRGQTAPPGVRGRHRLCFLTVGRGGGSPMSTLFSLSAGTDISKSQAYYPLMGRPTARSTCRTHASGSALSSGPPYTGTTT